MEPYLGEVRIFAGNFAPRGWAICDGSLLPVRQNQALFSLLGPKYGGDGTNTFALPDFRGRVPMHVGGSHTLGQRKGEAVLNLQADHLPAHNHAIQTGTTPAVAATVAATANTATAGVKCREATGGTQVQDPKNNYPANSSVSKDDKGYHSARGADDYLGGQAVTVTVGTAGTPNAISNMMPYLGLKFIIAIQGIYPPRS